MKRLLLVRHAKSSKDDPEIKDVDRPLAERGMRDAPEMGRRIARRGPRPDHVITSPALRAVETAKLISRELDFPWKEIRTERRLYSEGAGAMKEVIRAFEPEVEVAMVVGHNPDISEVAHLLAPASNEELPTGAVLALEFAIDSWHSLRPGKGRVLWYDTPKKPATF